MRKGPVFQGGVLGLLVLAGSACGGSDRPATSDSFSTNESGLATASPSHLCEPRSNRYCTVTFYDEEGRLQCPADFEICSVDGSEWLPCGKYVYDENHDPQPRQ